MSRRFMSCGPVRCPWIRSVFASLTIAIISSACGQIDSEQGASLAGVRGYQGRFPHTPDETLTPGSTCDRPSYYRYREKIPYCERNVKSSRKAEIFRTYDRELGFTTTQMERGQFKIDHYIPLCMGGSNDDDNLWPQHKSIYELTDPAEGFLCERMSEGSMLQREAIAIIRRIKETPEEASRILPAAF